jgi:hypothetical protein
LWRQKYLAAFHGIRSKPRVKLVEAAHFAYKRTFGSAVISP